MKCEIEILKVTPSSISGDVIEEVNVYGKVRGCEEVTSPYPNTPSKVIVSVSGVVLETDVRGTGSATMVPPEDSHEWIYWQTPIKGFEGIPCDSRVTIAASCNSDPSCSNEQEFIITCDCPSIGLHKIIDEDCNESTNTRRVVFSVRLGNVESDSLVLGHIFTRDGVGSNENQIGVQFPEDNEWVRDQDGVWERSYERDYQPGTYEDVRLVITHPQECEQEVLVVDSTQHGRVSVPGCLERSCPDSVARNVFRINDDLEIIDNVTSDVEHENCLSPGSYRIEVTEPEGDGHGFTWSVDNQNIPDPSDPNDPNYPVVSGINRRSYIYHIAPNEIHTISVSIDVLGCDHPVSGATRLSGCAQESNGPAEEQPGEVPSEEPHGEVPSGASPTGIPWCLIWFIISVVLVIAAGVSIIIAGCTVHPIAIGIAIGLTVLSIVNFILWGVFCAESACTPLLWFIDILAPIVPIAAIIGGVLVSMGIASCGIGAFLEAGYLGIILSVAYYIARCTGCLRTPDGTLRCFP